MNLSKYLKLSVICSCLSLAFSLSTISFNLDISLTALPLALVFTAVLAYSSYKKLFQQNNLYFIAVYRELLQYLPYVLLISFVLRRAGENGTPFVLDVLSVGLWLLVCVADLVLLHFINPKNIEKVSLDWKKYSDANNLTAEKKHKYSAFFSKKTKNPQISSSRKVLKEAVSWVDAIVQAVFMVLLLNIFIVQLYEIPSESMVPEFLIKDRVVVFKTFSGPKFPLSDISLPYLKKYKRGDIVVFRNPHYAADRKSEVRTFLSQLVYMCTLTKVNLNVEADGNPKADPLVKRVCGVGGEQLVMQDGILYSRTAASPEFKPVLEDSAWASWNLNSVKSSLKQNIQYIPQTQKEFEGLLKCEELRRNLHIGAVEKECFFLVRSFAKNYDSVNSSSKGDVFQLSQKDMNEYNLFLNNEALTQELLTSSNGKEWFNGFMTDWIKHIPDFKDDIYAEANFRLNLMIKLCFGRLAAANSMMYSSSSGMSKNEFEQKKYELLQEAEMLHAYVCFLDRRNMPVFPANDSDGNPVYIPENSYFMMGDNRFNSLDMRHSYDRWITKIAPTDEYSATYYTDIAPQYVNRYRMLGITSYRFWPLNRAGKPGLTGRK